MISAVTRRLGLSGGYRLENNRRTRLALSALGIVSFLAFWELSTIVFQLHPNFFPSPTAILTTLERVLPPILEVLPSTLMSAGVGYLFALLLAVALAVPLAASERLLKAIMPVIVGTNTLPRVAMTPLVVYWVGFFTTDFVELANYIMAAWVAFFPMLIAALDGFRKIDEERRNMLSLYGATTWQEFKYVRFKNGLPMIFDSMKYGFILAMIGTVVGEFISGSGGAGSMARSVASRTNVDVAIAIVIVLGLVSSIVVFLIYMIENRVIHWRDSSFMGGTD